MLLPGWGGSRGCSVEPPKVIKQTELFWPYFFFWKKDLLSNNKY